ncbi:MAG: ABC transporter ATP-binding protein [Firmicutes bacterium]|nr:ABC transporter ATP-binding protein [Bacillota bacterium]MDI6705722.1 ABC transporter ATP-binding protein [Bacillota bacterium]
MSYPLEVHNLYYSYPDGKGDILKGINLKAEEGEILAIVGLSGSGKSTLCYCLSGIIPHIFGGEMRGEVLIYGESTGKLKVPEIATRLGIVFQDPDTQLFSPTVEDEIAFGPENLCIDREEIGKRIDAALMQVRMEEFRFGSPNHFSGGQKQLIALASVLSLKPDILIFDEVMSQIDTEGRRAIKEIIKELKSAGKTVIMVEHDWGNLDIADRVLLLKDGKFEAFSGTL